MEIDLVALLKSREELLLFTIIGLGYLIGNIRLFKIDLGSSIGVLLISLVFGHYGFQLSKIVGTLGFIFFIYSVGYQAGPRFFASFREDGWRYVQICLVIATTSVLLVFGIGYFLQFPQGYSAGILAGALTSTPTLAAAQDAVTSGLITITPGLTPEAVKANIAVAYAITYIFGLLGLIFTVQVLPRLFGINLEEEAKQFAKKKGLVEEEDGINLPQVRVYSLDNEEMAGKTPRELRFIENTGCIILKVLRQNEEIKLTSETQLLKKDHIAIVGLHQNLLRTSETMGKEIDDPEAKTILTTTRVLINNSEAVGKSIRDTGISDLYACIPLRATRGGIELPMGQELILQKGDILEVCSTKECLERLVKAFGRAETAVHETDLLTFSFGICAGIILGTSTVKLGIPISIGMAGGLLIAGLIVGFMRTIHPFFGNVPHGARFILKELGILFFMASVGINAGSGLLRALESTGASIFFTGVIITLVPMLSGVFYGRYVLKMNPAILAGAITGGLTSTPALSVVTRTAKSNVPAIGYAGAYAFANILLTLVGQLVMFLS